MELGLARMVGTFTHTRLINVSVPPINLTSVETEWGAKKLISQEDARMLNVC